MLKRKIVAILLMFFAMPLFSSAMPQAEAASSFEDNLAEVAAGSATAAQIQELMKIRDTLSQDDKQALWGAIAQTAIERTGNADMFNNLATAASQLTAQDQADIKGDIIKVVETSVRNKVQGKVQEEVTDRLAEYQKEFELLATLLNSNNILTPKAVENNNALAGALQN